MDENILKYLFDIQNSINEIHFFFIACPKTFKEYQTNLLLKRAIERNLEIIGEAMNRILKVDIEFKITDSKRIIGLRNRIIHSYDSISEENIWGVIINYLPKLEAEVNILISNSQ